MASSADGLIRQYIEPGSDDTGPADARVANSGVHVWALVGYLRANGDDVAAAAADYELPVEAVAAALLYYDRHRAAIDARLALHDAFFAVAS